MLLIEIDRPQSVLNSCACWDLCRVQIDTARQTLQQVLEEHGGSELACLCVRKSAAQVLDTSGFPSCPWFVLSYSREGVEISSSRKTAARSTGEYSGSRD